MHSTFTIIKKYIQYYTKASNGKGHGVHSPFVYDFIRNVLMDKSKPDSALQIEMHRDALKKNTTSIEVWDRGAGSRQMITRHRKVNKIAASSLKPQKYAHLLYRIVAYFKPENVIEMGTSLGITTCYLATAANGKQVVTMEGAPTVAKIAGAHFEKMGLQNIQMVEGDFDQTLPEVLKKLGTVGLAYIDGNHKYIPTMQYFNDLLLKSNEASFFIFDDIHWSEEMENAWEQIKAHPAVTVTIDLFYIGLVFLRKEDKEPMHYLIRY